LLKDKFEDKRLLKFEEEKSLIDNFKGIDSALSVKIFHAWEDEVTEKEYEGNEWNVVNID
jgi:hypothetical protein